MDSFLVHKGKETVSSDDLKHLKSFCDVMAMANYIFLQVHLLSPFPSLLLDFLHLVPYLIFYLPRRFMSMVLFFVLRLVLYWSGLYYLSDLVIVLL